MPSGSALAALGQEALLLAVAVSLPVVAIAARPRPDDAFVHRTYPALEQRAVGARLAAEIGFDFEAGRLDESAHPFSGASPKTRA